MYAGPITRWSITSSIALQDREYNWFTLPGVSTKVIVGNYAIPLLNMAEVPPWIVALVFY